MLTKTTLKKIKEKLTLERDELVEKLTKRLDIDTDGDETDEVQGNMLIELENQLSAKNQQRLAQINSALQKIEDKTYGLCEDCEEDIPEKRLLINPYFSTCVSCAEERESEPKRRF